MSAGADFATWLRARGVAGAALPDRGGLVAVRRRAEEDPGANAALLADLPLLHAEFSRQHGLPRVVCVSARPMGRDHVTALAGVVFAGGAP